MMRVFISSFISVVLISGCVSTPVQAPITPSMPIPSEATNIATSTPNNMSVSLTQETETAELTFTPSLPSPTLDFEYCRNWGESTLDGKWAICDEYTDPVVFINQDNQVWQFSYMSFYGQEVKNPCTELLHTISDEMYIYFALPENCMMIEPWFPSTIGVFRINLTNGNVDRVLGENYDFQNYSGITYSVSISPTGRRMAYIINNQTLLTLNMVDLKTGENHSWQLDSRFLNGGLFKWSQDGTKLVFLLASEPREEYEERLISFAFLDLLKADSMVTFIYEKESIWITARIDVTDSGVRVEIYDEPPLFYDIKTGVLTNISN